MVRMDRLREDQLEGQKVWSAWGEELLQEVTGGLEGDRQRLGRMEATIQNDLPKCINELTQHMEALKEGIHFERDERGQGEQDLRNEILGVEANLRQSKTEMDQPVADATAIPLLGRQRRRLEGQLTHMRMAIDAQMATALEEQARKLQCAFE